jgi:hypothetical protein
VPRHALKTKYVYRYEAIAKSHEKAKYVSALQFLYRVFLQTTLMVVYNTEAKVRLEHSTTKVQTYKRREVLSSSLFDFT